jgi:hypothetical protein
MSAKKTSRKRSRKKPTDSEMLEDLLERIHEHLKGEEFAPKLADFLKVLEMKYKLKLTDDGKEKILEIIDKVRKEELGKADKSD